MPCSTGGNLFGKAVWRIGAEFGFGRGKTVGLGISVMHAVGQGRIVGCGTRTFRTWQATVRLVDYHKRISYQAKEDSLRW